MWRTVECTIPRTRCNCSFKSKHTRRSFKFDIAVSLCLPSSRQYEVSLSHQLRLQSVLPRDIIHVTILTLSITRAPAVNLTDVCTGTCVSKCKITCYVHLFTLEEDIFLDGVHFTLETKFKGTFFKRQLNVSSLAFFPPA